MSEPTTFELERMALGEIPTPEEYADAVAELRSSNEEILERYPVEGLVPSIRRAAPSDVAESSKRGGWGVVAGFAAAAASVAVGVGVWQTVERSSPRGALVPGNSGEVRVKGPEVRLQLWRQTGNEPELLEDGALVSAGDVVQPKFGVTEPGHGVLVAVDETDAMTVLFPDEGENTRLEPGGLRTTTFAFELDDTPGAERFYFFVCSEAIEPEDAIRWIRTEAPLDGRDCTIEKMELVK